ncbi:glycerophosphodiester phosphodiesterase [Nocardioides sp. SOB77]|uniref:Glycerophosphodiester phosphodiesterase n=1 Tax=Nocardioides oceani TaxID=3058369 RepID=A0ABT8FJ28_9ACTN|nr:glycerophosphodiester phosphodiesterase [Nocardioides oceani]MDN4174679.1 glycerophosphodiester phosphodiesterase [Nocardioides oceani]
MTPPAPVQLSAHRCLTREAVDRALALDVDFVEFDVERCADGTLVVFHDSVVEVDGEEVALADLTAEQLRAAVPDLMLYDEVLDALAGRRSAHLDLKFVGSCAEATARAVDRLGADNLVVTTLDDAAVREVRDWAEAHGHDLLVGLSLGRKVTGFPVWRQLRVRASEVWPHLRYRQSRANVVVAHHWLARAGLAGFARRRRLPLLVWTIDTPRSLEYWLRPGRAWLVTTNRPEEALAVRDRRTRRMRG